jgi:hypothetical protein
MLELQIATVSILELPFQITHPVPITDDALLAPTCEFEIKRDPIDETVGMPPTPVSPPAPVPIPIPPPLAITCEPQMVTISTFEVPRK